MIRVATDVGGTFTDLAAYDAATNAIIIAKASTTVDIAQGVADALEKASLKPAVADHFVHGSTVAINTVIERKGVKTGLLTTQGFRDVLEIARGNIVNSFDLMFQTPPPLVPRRLRGEIDERMAASGRVLRPIDRDQARTSLRALLDQGVEAIAVCLIHSYANAEHEREIRAIIDETCGNSIFATISSDILREYREFERTSTTVLNAYVGPRVSAYLDRLHRYLAEGGFKGTAMIMQSNGGTMTFDVAKVQPVRAMESGPVGGTVAAAHIAAKAGYKNVVAFDMGGTTAKVSIVRDGEMEIAEGYWIGGDEMGYPLQLPVVDVVEVGAGGGSIAHIDDTGALKVGPTSAGAVPGPACYGSGGVEPTVTDADVALGRLNPHYFLGGEIPLSVESAKAAIRRGVADPLGLDPVRAAFGIVKIADTHMAHAVRLMTVEKGHDPRDFILVAYGGAGPGHAVAVARALGIGTVVIPPFPGTLSAVGMLLTDAKEEFVQSRVVRLANADLGEIERLFTEMEQAGAARLVASGFRASDIVTHRGLEMRYTGQEFTLRLPVPEPVGSAGFVDLVARRFTELHERRYGHAFDRAVPEIVCLRVEVVARIAHPEIRARMPAAASADSRPVGKRQVYFEDCGFQECAVYRREALVPETRFDGPAVVEEMASTTLVHPGDTARVDGQGSLVITLARAAARV
jgi:N-methylhydantoinase A